MENPESLEAFLLWLGRDNVLGARKYEEVRRKLVLLFRCRGCPDPEELADETIDRTARMVQRPDFNYVGDPMAYFRGVARNIFYEWLRKNRGLHWEPITELHSDLLAPKVPPEDMEIMSATLERCLDKLPIGKKSLLLRYYQNDKRAKIDGRLLLAEQEGIGLNALRIQIFRLRNAVRRCVEIHSKEGEMQGSRTASHK